MSMSHTQPTRQAPSTDALRARIAGLVAQAPRDEAIFALDGGAIDAALGGGLRRGALHEILARAADAPAGAGFAAGLARRAAGERPLLWLRQETACRESGEIHAPGLAEFGLDPSRIILLRLGTLVDLLRAASEAAACPALGAVILESFGPARAIDLVVTRRLLLRAERTGVSLFLLRIADQPAPNAAMTRWHVASAPSPPAGAEAPGAPAFHLALRRHRAGLPERTWHVEWDRDRCIFVSACSPTLPRSADAFVGPALSRTLVPLSRGGSLPPRRAAA